MKIKIILSSTLCGLALFTFSSCTKYANPLDYTRKQLIFGSGGGFANQVNEYRLLENKRLYARKNNDSTFTSLGRQKAKIVKTFFKESDVLFQEKMTFNEPGNMYYFVRLKQQNQTQSVVWGRPNSEAPEKIKELHKLLMNLVHLN